MGLLQGRWWVWERPESLGASEGCACRMIRRLRVMICIYQAPSAAPPMKNMDTTA